MHASKGKLLLEMCSRPAPMVSRFNGYSTRIQMGNVNFVVVDREGRRQKRRNEIFGPANPRYPLPGDVMCAAQYQRHNQLIEGRELEELAEELDMGGNERPGKEKSDESRMADRRPPSMSVQDALERLLAPTSRSDSYVPPPLSSAVSSTAATVVGSESGVTGRLPLPAVEMYAYQCPSLLRLEVGKSR